MKKKIIEILSAEFGISLEESAAFYNNIFSVMADAFAKGKNLNIPEFGKFTIRYKKSADGKRTKYIKFSPVLKIAKEVNKNYDGLIPVALKEIIKNIKYQNGNGKAAEKKTATEDEKLFGQLIETSLEDPEQMEEEIVKDENEISFDLESMDDKMFEQFILSEANPLTEEEDLEVKDSIEFNIGNEKDKNVIEDEIILQEPATDAPPAEIIEEFSGFDVSTEEDKFKFPDDLKQLHEEIESLKDEDSSFTSLDPENDFNNIFAPVKNDLLDYGENSEIDIDQIKSFDDIFMPIAETNNVKEPVKKAVSLQSYKSSSRNITEEIESLKDLHDDINNLFVPKETGSGIKEEDVSKLNYANDEFVTENELKTKEEAPGEINFEKIEDLNLIDHEENLNDQVSAGETEFKKSEEPEDFNIFGEDLGTPEIESDESVFTDENQNIKNMDDKNYNEKFINSKDDFDKELEKIEEANAKDRNMLDKSGFGSFDPLAAADDYEKKLNEEVEKIYSEKEDVIDIAKDLDDQILDELNKKIENLEGEIRNKIEHSETTDIVPVTENILKPEESKSNIIHSPIVAPVKEQRKELPREKNNKPETTDEKRKLIEKYAPNLNKISNEDNKVKKNDKNTYTTLIVFLFVVCALILLYGIFSNSIFRETPPAGLTEVRTPPPVTEQAPPVQQQPVTTPPPTTQEQQQTPQEPVTTPPPTTQQQTPPPVQTQTPPPTTTARQIVENNVIYNETANGFTIQAGSFKDKPNADKKLNELKQSGLAGFVEEADLGEKGKFFRVKIGYFKTIDEARSNAGKIK